MKKYMKAGLIHFMAYPSTMKGEGPINEKNQPVVSFEVKPWGDIEKLGELTVYDRTPESEILNRIGDAEVVFTNKTPLTKHTLENANSIKFIGVLATGYNVVDCDEAKERGINK